MRVIKDPLRGWICISEKKLHPHVTEWRIRELSDNLFIRFFQILYYKMS